MTEFCKTFCGECDRCKAALAECLREDAVYAECTALDRRNPGGVRTHIDLLAKAALECHGRP